MQTVEIIPSASALMQSLRGFGYSPETAVADLIDNSIAAGATRVDIDIEWNDSDPRVAVLDDGAGLDGDALVFAMTFGGAGPVAERPENDLGRFGLGLKTASLSQCRRMTVASRQDRQTVVLSWDVDEVQQRGRWVASIPDELPSVPLAERLAEQPNGSLVVWERMDAIGGLYGLDKEAFFLRIQDIRAHAAMVFHRFIGGDAQRLAIVVNGRPVLSWDPFQRSHPATITMPTERLRHSGRMIVVTPHVLPHRDRFGNDAEYEAAGGPGGWGERQGFYVYRGKRLVVAGGWLGLGGTRAWSREESSRLARIAIDLPLGVDAEWRIDVRKSLARPPATMRSRLTAIGTVCRERAREVFAWRGNQGRRRMAPSEDDALWIAESTASRLRYRINRAHPAVRAVAERLNDDAKVLDGLLALIEISVPVERIWLDVSEADGAGAPPLGSAETAELASRIASLLSAMPGDESASDRLDNLLRQLPGAPTSLRQSILKLVETTA
ncbi:ATP-binding protein [Chelativorans sp. M5D2P16]|uniref:ATP-binding protein n=1 Tax=Chelativorans sp. M5D2P16 TaxID=3095678 RepID=UPI002ACAEA76|nr:ATP-binding protein [Chelativorans sp. M5D2P16]MDZ5698644.1 ATP-binding protein [Chelativorans sp. M5D2P16]